MCWGSVKAHRAWIDAKGLMQRLPVDGDEVVMDPNDLLRQEGERLSRTASTKLSVVP